jgi:hypothetical protein
MNPALNPFKRAMTVFKRPHFSPFKAYVRRDLKLVVCLNPKVGSTAFRSVLVDGMKRHHLDPMRGGLWPLNETRRYMTASIGDYFHAFGNPEEYEFVCFVRNPYARVISAWNDKMVRGHREGYSRSMKGLVPKVKQFAEASGLAGSEPDEVVPFDTFLHFVESKPEGQRNQHWDSQVLVLAADLVPFKGVYDISTEFTTGMCDVLSRLGIDSEWVAEKVAKPANASGKIKEPVLTEELASRVYQIYKRDFDHFGFDPESWKGK